MNLPYASCTAMCDALVDLANTGYLRIYDGTQPANADTAVTTQVLLVQFTLPATAFGAASNGVASVNTVTGVNAAASGTASWCRVVAANGTTTLWDGTVGEAGSGADVIISSATISAGGAVSVTSWTVTVPRVDPHL